MEIKYPKFHDCQRSTHLTDSTKVRLSLGAVIVLDRMASIANRTAVEIETTGLGVTILAAIIT